MDSFETIDGLLNNSNFSTFITTYLTIILVIMLIICIIQIVAMWKLFKKANEAGWKSIVPIYNLMTYYKIANVSPYLAIVYLLLIGVASALNPTISLIALVLTMVINIYQSYKLAKAFNKGIGYTIGLLFLNSIFILILAFGNSEYVGNNE